jgi:hypothetical protein
VNKPNNGKSKIIKPKPIYIKDKKFSEILDTMKSLKITKYSIKIISGGIKLSVGKKLFCHQGNRVLYLQSCR